MTLATTILIFSAIAAIFYLVAAIQTSRIFLVPAGGILIVLGSMILASQGILINTGDTTTIRNETITNTSTGSEINAIENKTARFRNIETRYQEFSPSEMISLILIFTGVMSMILGADYRGNLLKAFKQ